MLLSVVEGLLDWFLWTLLIIFFLDIHHKNLNTQSQEYLLSTLLEYFVFDFCVETSYNIIIYYILSLINLNRRKPTHYWMMISISVFSKYVPMHMIEYYLPIAVCTLMNRWLNSRTEYYSYTVENFSNQNSLMVIVRYGTGNFRTPNPGITRKIIELIV